MKLAQEHALAESIVNPRKRKVEKLNTVDDTGHVSQITLTGGLKASGETDTEVEIDGQSNNASDARKVPTISVPFRDLQWEKIERPYLGAAVENLNVRKGLRSTLGSLVEDVLTMLFSSGQNTIV